MDMDINNARFSSIEQVTGQYLNNNFLYLVFHIYIPLLNYLYTIVY